MHGGNDPNQVHTSQLNHYGNDINSSNPTFVPNTANQSNGRSTRFLHDASFLRLRNVSLSYGFPKEWMKKIYLKGASISLNAENLWAHFFDPNFKGFDIETGLPGNITQEIPNPTTVSIGLKLNI